MYPRRTFTPVLQIIYEEPPTQHSAYEQAIIAQFSYLMM